LEQSDIDFSEELGKLFYVHTKWLYYLLMMLVECQRLKAQVVQEIRANQQLEQDLNIMDIKIGLLVKNRITLQVGVAATLPYKENEAAMS